MRSTIINLIPITKGGGLQNTLSFLRELARDEPRRDESVIYCRAGSEIAEFCKDRLPHVHSIGSGAGARFAAEAKLRNSGGVCFTFFGAPTFGCSEKTVNVCGCAYSNLLYKDLDFWDHLSGLAYWKRRFVDFLRKRALERADFWIFETETLRRRAVELCGFPSDRVAVVKMAPSSLVAPERVDQRLVADFRSSLPAGFKILLLAGAHPNKRQMALPKMIDALMEQGARGFSFVTTMAAADPYCVKVTDEIGNGNRRNCFRNLGPIPPDRCASLISACDAMMCISRLESFSNNFVEAWKMGKPLIVTDADWSREACGTGAMYIDPMDPENAAKAIGRLIKSKDVAIELSRGGVEALASYNTAESKYAEYWRVIGRASVLGKISLSERKRIAW